MNPKIKKLNKALVRSINKKTYTRKAREQKLKDQQALTSELSSEYEKQRSSENNQL